MDAVLNLVSEWVSKTKGSNKSQLELIFDTGSQSRVQLVDCLTLAATFKSALEIVIAHLAVSKRHAPELITGHLLDISEGLVLGFLVHFRFSSSLDDVLSAQLDDGLRGSLDIDVNLLLILGANCHCDGRSSELGAEG